MGLFGKSKKELLAEIAKTGLLLTAAKNDIRVEREQRRLAEAERDARTIEMQTAQRERDDYRERLLRFTGPRQRGERGRFLKAVEAA